MASDASRHIRTVIGENIRRARDQNGLTQRELAAAIEGDYMAISRWERGVNRPGDESLARIAEVLGHDFAWFYVDHSAEPTTA